MATFGPLFMVQGISAVIVALALVRTGYVLVVAAEAARPLSGPDGH